MFFFVKVRVDMDRLPEFGRRLQSGELISGSVGSTYCLAADPEVGMSVWEAESRDDFERKFAPYREFYAQVIEVETVVLAADAQKMLFERMRGLKRQ
jgi:hypothetical protein